MMMHYLFTAEGERAIDDVLATKPLLAFDFDGTLAPIVTEPDAAYPDEETVALMQDLVALAPVAVITGRAIDDARARLGFTPKYLVGNHGAEGIDNPHEAEQSAVLQTWREFLSSQQAELAEAGVSVEDKGRSFSLHFRRAPDLDYALRFVEYVTQTLQPRPEVIGGKCVVNLLPQGAPTKFTALQALLAREHSSSALFIGDDITDDIVFAKAPEHWLTIRVGLNEQSRARFVLTEQSEVALLLRSLKRRLQATQHSPV